MIAYLILVHRYPEQFKRLFSAIYNKDDHYLIHVDKKSGTGLLKNIRDYLTHYPNATLLESEKAVWGGFSLVNIELRGMRKLLESGIKWTFFINLSGQDFPLKSSQFIHNYLTSHIGKDFIKLSEQYKTRPETRHRIEEYVTDSGNEIIANPEKKRSFMPGVIPYIGNQWFILSRKFCEFLTYSPEVDRFIDFYRHTLIADEGFFQTVIMNTSYQASIINDDKREIDWIPMGKIKLRPRDYTILDADLLQNTPNLFARKFDENIDQNILSLLEKHLVLEKRTASTA
ncbi:Core-2/I-Branching enzyme [Pragia fontium]|uniref:Peptide O-xylosyltransferase n=2 Tax=Pragia fontium TaxID=82985 RepID=A0AAJ5BIL5_9GAMM|nr:beta-1,6-N-acetylglucosaminyltransferase [Pragia fontium]GKX61623.1 glycosyl transferase [Pragia fontium]SFD41337.1 Core-2/I-Branching enzyme [Pragia fontium DSM 5563 = ATCC 49100]SUB82580.1 Core-2/I-Branching enzyme [Pragia fontium]